ncbi:MAG TPA: cytochrome c-type biogenesis protein [Gallionellaceae bacterium]|nr:cytochrome c-type biogenesis protein [Gallionellaceae bacterium]
MRKLALAALLLFMPAAVLAEEAKDMAKNPVIEKRMIALTSKLRCLVCQNESLAASQAGLAKDLREEVREQMIAGKTDKQITDYLVARYGDFVLYDPPVRSYTLFLWGGPFLFMLGGAGILAYQLRKRRKAVRAPELDAEAQRRAAALLEGKEK